MKAEIIDGFAWAILDREEATAYIDSAPNWPLSAINNEGDEIFPVELFADVVVAEELQYKVAKVIDDEQTLKADWQEATARNNETRTFEAWLQDKAESLIN